MDAFEGWDAVVIGVSPDSGASHRKFIANHEINFTLLTDEDFELCKMFDVLREKKENGKSSGHLERTTFLVDPDGYITWIERPVSIDGHAERVLEALQEMEE